LEFLENDLLFKHFADRFDYVAVVETSYMNLRLVANTFRYTKAAKFTISTIYSWKLSLKKAESVFETLLKYMKRRTKTKNKIQTLMFI